MEKEKLFTIGQFAALHQINKKTLMWYDEIGLFKPAKIEENGYRSYTYHQSAELEAILMMRELDMSIPDIKCFLENRCADAYIRLLKRKTAELAEKIDRMRHIHENLIQQDAFFSELQHKDLSGIELVKQKEEYLYIVASEDGVTFEEEAENMITAVKEHNFSTLHDTTYGSILSVSHLQNGEYSQYDGLFMKMPGDTREENIHRKPGGTYLLAYYKGSWEGLPGRYEQIMEYAHQENLTLYGYSYEIWVNEILIDSMDDYITQIEIPVHESTILKNKDGMRNERKNKE